MQLMATLKSLRADSREGSASNASSSRGMTPVTADNSRGATPVMPKDGRIKSLLEMKEKELKAAEEKKTTTKMAIKTWQDQFQKDNGRAPTNADKASVKSLFEDFKLVSIQYYPTQVWKYLI